MEWNTKYVDLVFDGPPGPTSPKFVELEDDRKHSINMGEWFERMNNRWALRLPIAAYSAVHAVFDGPPEDPPPPFVKLEDDRGDAIEIGEWLQRPDGYWVLRLPIPATIPQGR
jgi:hypothetical protein